MRLTSVSVSSSVFRFSGIPVASQIALALAGPMPIDVAKRDGDVLARGKVYACNTGHDSVSLNPDAACGADSRR